MSAVRTSSESCSRSIWAAALLVLLSVTSSAATSPMRRAGPRALKTSTCVPEAFNLGTVIPTDPEPFSVAVVDVDNDGNLDLVVGSASTGAITTYLGDGAGNFSLGPILSAGTYVTAIAAADFNGDGNVDLVAATDSGSRSTTATAPAPSNSEIRSARSTRAARSCSPPPT